MDEKNILEWNFTLGISLIFLLLVWIISLAININELNFQMIATEYLIAFLIDIYVVKTQKIIMEKLTTIYEKENEDK